MKENSIEDRIEEKYTRYLNCKTDTLELTIEEAIYILEKDASFHYVEDLLQEAYKVILSDYKRVLKENKELKEDRDKFKKALGKRITYCNELEKDLFENGSNYVIPKQIVKDKIEEYDKQRIKMEKDDIGVGFTLGKEWSDLKAKIEALQDLLEKE